MYRKQYTSTHSSLSLSLSSSLSIGGGESQGERGGAYNGCTPEFFFFFFFCLKKKVFFFLFFLFPGRRRSESRDRAPFSSLSLSCLLFLSLFCSAYVYVSYWTPLIHHRVIQLQSSARRLTERSHFCSNPLSDFEKIKQLSCFISHPPPPRIPFRNLIFFFVVSFILKSISFD